MREAGKAHAQEQTYLPHEAPYGCAKTASAERCVPTLIHQSRAWRFERFKPLLEVGHTWAEDISRAPTRRDVISRPQDDLRTRCTLPRRRQSCAALSLLGLWREAPLYG